MPDHITIRKATPGDIPGMLDVYLSGFGSSPLHHRCFPPSEPEVQAYWLSLIRKGFDDPASHVVLALLPPAQVSGPVAPAEASSGLVIAGWVRWVRKPTPSTPVPPAAFSPSIYPSVGDGAVASRFYQAHHDATRRIVDGEPHWYIGPIVTSREFQRRGVGAALMEWGVRRVDEDGWMAYVTGSEDGRRLYEKFGFGVVEETEFEELGMTQFHMTRPAKTRSRRTND